VLKPVEIMNLVAKKTMKQILAINGSKETLEEIRRLAEIHPPFDSAHLKKALLYMAVLSAFSIEECLDLITVTLGHIPVKHHNPKALFNTSIEKHTQHNPVLF